MVVVVVAVGIIAAHANSVQKKILQKRHASDPWWTEKEIRKNMNTAHKMGIFGCGCEQPLPPFKPAEPPTKTRQTIKLYVYIT